MAVSSAQGPRVAIEGKSYLLFCSNNYLGLASSKALQERAKEAGERYGFGSGASRYISGNVELYDKLEEALAEWKQKESALVFPTGYQANVGTLAALLSPDATVFSDQYNHASLIDGIRLSKAKVVVYPHGDSNFLEDQLRRTRGEKWVVTDGIFSMDGDGAPLAELAALKEKYGFSLYVDDAHGSGVVGEKGRGYAHAQELAEPVDFLMGTFSKALGSLGGFITASRRATAYLRNRCRSLIYTTALPAPVLGFNLSAVELVPQLEEKRRRLRALSHQLFEGLKKLGFSSREPVGPILPLVVGSSEGALALSRRLREKGFFVPAIRPPTVPSGSARLRLSVMADHTKEDIEGLLDALRVVFGGTAENASALTSLGHTLKEKVEG